MTMPPALGTRAPSRQWRVPQWMISILVTIGLGLCWEVLSYAFPTSGTEAGTGSPLIPGWGWVATRAFPAIANYGGDGGGLTAAEGGIAGSYSGAIVAIAHHSMITWVRLLAGLLGGLIMGVGLAVAISWSRIARIVLALPAHVLKTLPLLATIPLFQVWFGVSQIGMCLFVAYGVGVVVFAGTLNAIANVRPIFIVNARTLGASPIHVYRTVILPAIAPELRTSLMLGVGVAWSAVVGAEFLGAQDGLGFVEVQAKQFALLDRMMVVALFFLLYAFISFFIVERLSRRFIAWMPQTQAAGSRE